MKVKQDALSPQLKALMTTDLSPMIRMSGLMVPRMLGVFMTKLDARQKKVFDKVMPVGGKKKFFTHLVGTPTPPIVIQMAQPLGMSVMSPDEVQKQKIKGVKLTIGDLQAFQQRKIGKILRYLIGQIGPILGISGMFTPFILLGPKGLKDLKKKAMTHFKPLLDLMPH